MHAIGMLWTKLPSNINYNSRLLQIIDPILDPRNVKKAHGATEQSFWLIGKLNES